MPTEIRSYSPVKLEPYMVPEGRLPITDHIAIASTGAVQTFAKGTVMGQLTDATGFETGAIGMFTAYDPAETNGSEVARCILIFDITVDTTANGGRITLTGTTGQVGGPNGEMQEGAPAYFGGIFKVADLVASGAGAFDAGALADLNGRYYIADTVIIF